MATTTKTLAPTGTTVTLPDMTERPNASVLVDGIGKEADAINTLNSNIKYETVADYDDFKPTTPFVNRYGYSTSGSAANAPFTGDGATFRGYTIGSSDNYYTQYFTAEYTTTIANRGRSFIRQCIGGTLGEWMEITRQLPQFTISGGGSSTFTMTQYAMCIMFINGYKTASQGAVLLMYNNGALAKKWLGDEPSNITITANSSGVITVANADNSGVVVRMHPMQGSITM